MVTAFCLLVPVSFLVWIFANVSKLPRAIEAGDCLSAGDLSAQVTLLPSQHGQTDGQMDGYSLWIWTWLGGRGWSFLDLGYLEGPL